MVLLLGEAMGASVLLLATTSRCCHHEFHFTWEKKVSCPSLVAAQNLLKHGLSNWVRIAKVVACFPQASLLLSNYCLQWLQPTQKRPVFVLACPTSGPSCAPALPKEPHYWLFCSQNLWLPSWIAFRSDCQMTCRGSNLDLNFNSAAWTTSCHGLSALKSQNNLCGVWIVLTSLGLLKNPNWGRWWVYTNPHLPDWHWWFWVYPGPVLKIQHWSWHYSSANHIVTTSFAVFKLFDSVTFANILVQIWQELNLEKP